MSDREILAEFCAIKDIGPLFDGRHFDVRISLDYGRYLGRVRAMIDSARQKLARLPPVYADFVRNPRFNAFAVIWGKRYLIGIHDSIPIVVSLIVNRMLADPRAFTHVGNPSLERSDLPVFTDFTKDASALAPAGIQHIYHRDLMNAHVRDCLVTGYEDLIDSLTLPDPDDHQVLAAASRSGADVIVTSNLSDFPQETLSQYGTDAQHPDEFVMHLIDLAPNHVCSAAKKQLESLKNSPLTVEQFLVSLQKQGLPQTVATLRQYADLI